ncbi:DUF1127 domain-containing protein [Seohaeicola saemankumensis]|nr:DUF1127 domain-containing protein [Seohaeicola saemankumensis]MCA0873186.1 DUF1127 domain-containing protein [Seohaeicola saemankumensis]
MTVFDTNRTNYDTARAFGRIGTVIANVISAISAWNDARVTRNALSNLTDRELDDIGLIRGDIDSVVHNRPIF